MPFILGGDDTWHKIQRPIKRRKLSSDDIMAGQQQHRQEKKLEQSEEQDLWLLEDVSQETSEQKERSNGETEITTSSREELIECIKRGQKPKWKPRPALQALCKEEDALHEHRAESGPSHAETPTQHLIDRPALFSGPLPQRPPSALHRGNFSDASSSSNANTPLRGETDPASPTSPSPALSTSPTWHAESALPSYGRAIPYHRDLIPLDTSFTGRQRAPSLGSSLSSSFVMRTPTSPLVHATSNPYLDEMPHASDMAATSMPTRTDRRRTMPPHAFHSLAMTPADIMPPNFSRPFGPISLRRESSMPHQTHQPRRSLTSFTYQPRSNPHTPIIRSRRPSLASDSSARRRTSMIGSFEESILRGRMSTPPSKPLDFVAQIGVMGKGDCSSSLKCPAHVSVPFPAVFYSYPSSRISRSLSDDTPSPYVGTIDLEHNLKPITLAAKKRSKNSGKLEDLEGTMSTPQKQDADKSANVQIGGAYRVPKQGQLQIIIKNPNKTAVKLFLVPYDLDGMEAGTKTFVRQRSFSSGPIIEHALGDKARRSSIVDPLEDKHVLRYLIHLKFCCPSKNRYYLYENIRVVFANRVPDGKEKLRNEIQVPGPRFSSFKPIRKDPSTCRSARSEPSTPHLITSMLQTSPTPGNAMPSFLHDNAPSPNLDLPRSFTSPIRQSPISPTISTRPPFQFPDLSFHSPSTNTNQHASSLALHLTDRLSPSSTRPERPLSPVHGFHATTPPRGSPVPWRSPPGTISPNINRSFSPVPESGDGLLSRGFRLLQNNGHSLNGASDESLKGNSAELTDTNKRMDKERLFK